MEFHGQSLALIIGPQVGRCDKNAAHQRTFVVAALQVFGELSGQRALGPVGEHLDRINKVLTFRTQLAVTLGFRQGVRRLAWMALRRVSVSTPVSRDTTASGWPRANKALACANFSELKFVFSRWALGAKKPAGPCS